MNEWAYILYDILCSEIYGGTELLYKLGSGSSNALVPNDRQDKGKNICYILYRRYDMINGRLYILNEGSKYIYIVIVYHTYYNQSGSKICIRDDYSTQTNYITTCLNILNLLAQEVILLLIWYKKAAVIFLCILLKQNKR